MKNSVKPRSVFLKTGYKNSIFNKIKQVYSLFYNFCLLIINIILFRLSYQGRWDKWDIWHIWREEKCIHGFGGET